MSCGDYRQTTETSYCPDSAATHCAFAATPKRNSPQAICEFEYRRTCAEPAVEARQAHGVFPGSQDRAAYRRECCSTARTTSVTRVQHPKHDTHCLDRLPSALLRFGIENPDSRVRARAPHECHRRNFR